jgi:hypothetical protein
VQSCPDDKSGVFYAASGQEYIEEAVQSAKSVKRHTSLPTALCTGEEVSHPAFDQVIESSSGTSDPYEQKVERLRCSPFEKTLFLDTDTYVCRDISDLFGLLDPFELAAAHAPYRHYHPKKDYPSDHPLSFPELNTGVLLLDTGSERIDRFLKDWLRLHRDMNDREGETRKKLPDQFSFREVVYESDLRFTVLTPEYNCRFIFPVYVQGPVRILHGRHSDLSTVERVANRRTGPRVLNPDIFKTSLQSRLRRLLRRMYKELQLALSVGF